MKGRDESCVSVYRCEQRELSAWKEKLSEYCRNSGQTLAATDCRAFTEDLIETVRSHSAMEAFYGRYTDADVLLIEIWTVFREKSRPRMSLSEF